MYAHKGGSPADIKTSVQMGAREGSMEAGSFLEGGKGIQQLQQLLLPLLLARHLQVGSHFHQGCSQPPSQHLDAGMCLLQCSTPSAWTHANVPDEEP